MTAEYYVIKVSGPDQPGITAKLMASLQEHGACLKDIGQSITHGLLSLSFLIEHTDSSELIKDLLFLAKQLEMQLDYQKVDAAEVSSRGESYIISCISPEEIRPSFMRDIAALLASYHINIKRIDNLHPEHFKTLDLSVQFGEDQTGLDEIKERLLALSHDHAVDLALLKDNVWRRNKRLIVFDMDSTLIQSEVIVEMAKVHGVGDKVHAITESAMNGEINFDQSLVQRVSLLQGLHISQMKSILNSIQLTEGVETFMSKVKKLGYKTAIISGGFQFFAHYFQQKLGIDYVFANDLEIEDEKLTGNIKGTIVNAEQKAIHLEQLAQREGINLEQVVAIGDGANDLPMLATAGLGIAFHAKDIVKKEAKQHMSFGNMASILYFLGISEEV